MRKRIVARGNIHKSDYHRALMTDTLPGDIPIIISNDGFYRNMQANAMVNSDQSEFVTLVLHPARSYTIPYRYNILRSGETPRRLSLIHPSGQLGVVNFYRQYAELICYYCRKSDASIRSPRKIGSLFFIRGYGSGKNSIKHPAVDTIEIENTVSNPASFFSYSGVDRVFKFFTSTDYLRLEKRYAVMHSADIAKCFNSIYTHTLFWATADITTAKDNRFAAGFSNSFDHLMQSVNYGETNGICIGAEVSRVFAELILSEVDRRAILRLEEQGLRFRANYEFRRYVDDFYIFSQNEKVAEQVLSVVRACLSEFNLHLNEFKTLKVLRPFITKKTRLVRDADRTLSEFFGKFIQIGAFGGDSYSYPMKIRRPQALLRTLLDSVKASCFDNRNGYGETANYVIGALGSRIASLINGYEQASIKGDVPSENYVSALMLLLEAIYFFYNVDPSVPSSLRVAQVAILSFNFFERRVADRAPFLAEQIVQWTTQFINELSGATVHQDSGCVPLEAINVLLVLGEIGRGEILVRHAMMDFCSNVENAYYFEIVSYLFCIKGDPEFHALREKLFNRACLLLLGKDKLRIEAHAAHLALDLLSCPFIPRMQRAALFNRLRLDVGLSQLSNENAAAAVKAFEDSPWFVDWREANLLAMIRKKELTAVY